MMDTSGPFQLSYHPLLPVELLLKICKLACTSQAVYHKLLLVSRSFYNLVKAECLAVVPLVLDNPVAISSFCKLVKTPSDIATRVRYLWISGDTEDTDEVVKACRNVVVLACSDRNVVSICSLPRFQHTKCTEFTLTDYSWYLWHVSARTRRCWTFFRQLTHIHLPEKLVRVTGPPSSSFTNPTVCSQTPRTPKLELIRDTWELQDLPFLSSITVTVESNAETIQKWFPLRVQSLDSRLSILTFKNDRDKQGVWCGGVA